MRIKFIMKRSSTIFLKVVIFLIAIGALAGLIRFPQTEGRAANLDLMSIYFDPLIIYIYIGSVPFFIGLYQAIKLLNFIEAINAFSQGAVNTLKKMKFAFLSLIGFILFALLYLRYFAHGDDPAGPTALGMVLILATGVIAAATGVFQKLLQNSVDLRSEHDLTV
jgi:hypothetical protein